MLLLLDSRSHIIRGPDPCYTLMCSCSGPVPQSEQRSSQVLKHKGLLCSLSGDGTVSLLCASVPQFPCLALVLGLLVLPVFRNSVDCPLGICFSTLFAGKYAYVLTFGNLFGITIKHHGRHTLSFMCLLDSTVLMSFFFFFLQE